MSRRVWREFAVILSFSAMIALALCSGALWLIYLFRHEIMQWLVGLAGM